MISITTITKYTCFKRYLVLNCDISLSGIFLYNRELIKVKISIFFFKKDIQFWAALFVDVAAYSILIIDEKVNNEFLERHKLHFCTVVN